MVVLDVEVAVHRVGMAMHSPWRSRLPISASHTYADSFDTIDCASCWQILISASCLDLGLRSSCITVSSGSARIGLRSCRNTDQYRSTLDRMPSVGWYASWDRRLLTRAYSKLHTRYPRPRRVY